MTLERLWDDFRDDGGMILGCLWEARLVPFGIHVRYLFGVVVCIVHGVAPGPPFDVFRLHVGPMLVPFSVFFGDPWF